MKNISENLKKSIQKEVLNLVKCCKISTINDEIFGFTTDSKSFVYNDLNYSPFFIQDIHNIQTSLDTIEDVIEITCIASNENIFSNHILSNKFDNAKIDIFLLDASDINSGQITLITGKISLIKFENLLIKFQIKGLKNELNKTIGSVYSPLCRICFCDNKCKLDIAKYSFNGRVADVESNKIFTTNSNEIMNLPEHYFEKGIIIFNSGKNKNYKMEISSFKDAGFVLMAEMPFEIEKGDEFTAIEGCDKSFSTCCNKFHNAINFRGEPHIPGINLLLKVK